MQSIRTGFVRIALALASTATGVLAGVGVYMEPVDFIADNFSGEPEQKVVWLNRETKTQIQHILGHPYKGLRIRYWELDGRTAWILEAIGKVELITAGFIVEDEELQKVQVLIYRETHGWEVRYPFFTNQFKGSRLDNKGGLNRRIDGISGATLSVNALVRLSELALYLDGQVRL